MKILITSGGTKIPIDQVRHISNMSKGTFGSKIATESLRMGYNVHFFHAENSKTPTQHIINFSDKFFREELHSKMEDVMAWINRYTESSFKTFDDYTHGLYSLLETQRPDILILAAAVSDYGVENYMNGKLRSQESLQINLYPLPKIISQIKRDFPSIKLVGFKLLVNSNDQELLDAAKNSIDVNGCELVVANDLQDIRNNNHKIMLVKRDSIGWIINKHESKSNPDSNYLAKIIVNELLYL